MARLGEFKRSRPCDGAFTLVEIMVVVSLLSLMVYGLYSMFSQTQKLLRANNSQVDIFESGRAAMEVIGRELEQTTYSGMLATNFMPSLAIQLDYTNGLKQPLVDRSVRTNVLQGCFFLSRPKNRWAGNGFFVATTTNSGTGMRFTTNAVGQIGVGTLYRFASPVAPEMDGQVYLTSSNVVTWYTQYTKAKVAIYTADLSTNLLTATKLYNPAYPITDGVVHFRVRPCDPLGREITVSNFPPNTVVVPDYWTTVWGAQKSYFFYTNLPAYLDVELGIIDPQALQKVRALSNPVLQRNFLTNQVNAVHLFRRLIPLRNAQPWPPS